MITQFKRVILLTLIGSVFVVPAVWSQGANPFAPSSAMDEMNEASVTGGMSTGTYMDRAREVGREMGVSQQPSPQSMGKMGMRGPAEMPPGEREMYAGMGRAMGQGGAYGQQGPTPSPTPKQIRVLAGSRVHCAVSGALLEDIVYKQVPESEKGAYYDDGSHGDAEAGDGTYTNITIRKDVMSPESHEILQRLMTLLSNIEQTEPMDFYRLFAVTSNPLSSLSKQLDEEQDRDIKLTEWNDRFLRMFRVNENDPSSRFYPLYIPPPVSYPNAPVPQGFQPVKKATPTPEGAEAGLGGMSVMGEGRGGHKGSYYDANKMGGMI